MGLPPLLRRLLLLALLPPSKAQPAAHQELLGTAGLALATEPRMAAAPRCAATGAVVQPAPDGERRLAIELRWDGFDAVGHAGWLLRWLLLWVAAALAAKPRQAAGFFAGLLAGLLAAVAALHKWLEEVSAPAERGGARSRAGEAGRAVEVDTKTPADPMPALLAQRAAVSVAGDPAAYNKVSRATPGEVKQQGATEAGDERMGADRGTPSAVKPECAAQAVALGATVQSLASKELVPPLPVGANEHVGLPRAAVEEGTCQKRVPAPPGKGNGPLSPTGKGKGPNTVPPAAGKGTVPSTVGEGSVPTLCLPSKGPPAGAPPGGKGKGPSPPSGVKGKGKGPGPKGAGGSAPEQVPEPRKPVVQPPLELKQLRWKRLQLGFNVPEGNTIWDKVPELPEEQLPVDLLLELFSRHGRSAAPISLSQGALGSPAAAAAPHEVRIIDGTIQRCGRESALSKLPPAQELAVALQSLDEARLLAGSPAGAQVAEVLRLVRDNVCPTVSQQERLEQAKAEEPAARLGNIERFMWEVSRVPAFRARIECWLYLSTCEEDFVPVCGHIDHFNTIVHCFRSPALPQLLGVILSIGNYLNGGTKDGRADGFSLDVLRTGGMDTVRDSRSKGDLRHFVLRVYLDKCRQSAATLLKDLRPALKNVRRTLEAIEGGSLRMRKQVKVALERTCDEALGRLHAELAEQERNLLQVTSAVGEDSVAAVAMRHCLERVRTQLQALQDARDVAKEAFARLLAWMHCSPQETSESFFLLWDDLLIPRDRFESQEPTKVRSTLKPIFCDDAGEIDVYGLARLWEAEVGGLQARARSGSAGPRGRSMVAPAAATASQHGRACSLTSWQQRARSRPADIAVPRSPSRPADPSPSWAVARHASDGATNTRGRQQMARYEEPPSAVADGEVLGGRPPVGSGRSPNTLTNPLLISPRRMPGLGLPRGTPPKLPPGRPAGAPDVACGQVAVDASHVVRSPVRPPALPSPAELTVPPCG